MDVGAAHVAGGETRIPVRLKRVARGAFASQLTQHLPAVLTVLAAGGSAIQSEREGGALALAGAELVVGAFVLGTIAYEAWHLFGQHAAHDAMHGSVHDGAMPVHAMPVHAMSVHAMPVHAMPVHAEPWIDRPGLAAAALGYVEVWHRTHERGRFKLVSPQMLGATATLVLALGGRRLIAHRFRHRRPHVLVTPTTLAYRGSRRRRWTTAWNEVAALEQDASALTIRLRNGSAHVVRADDHFDGAALVTAMHAAALAHAPAHLTGGRVPTGSSTAV